MKSALTRGSPLSKPITWQILQTRQLKNGAR